MSRPAASPEGSQVEFVMLPGERLEEVKEDLAHVLADQDIAALDLAAGFPFRGRESLMISPRLVPSEA
jgi:hypothetical protein